MQKVIKQQELQSIVDGMNVCILINYYEELVECIITPEALFEEHIQIHTVIIYIMLIIVHITHEY